MTHFCSTCEFQDIKSTKYHTCPSCSSKLQYKCPKCARNIYSSNSKHLKRCKVQTEITTPNNENTESNTNFSFGKRKIMCEFQSTKFCIAYFNKNLNRIQYGKERPKFNGGGIQKKKKDQIKYLKKKSNIKEDEEIINFSSLYSK